MSEIRDYDSASVWIESIASDLFAKYEDITSEIWDIVKNIRSDDHYESPQGFPVYTGSTYNNDDYAEAESLYEDLQEEYNTFWDTQIKNQINFLSIETQQKLKADFFQGLEKNFEDTFNL